MIKLIIAGTRTFDNYSLLKDRCNVFLEGFDEIEIVCGMAIGADELGRKFGLEKGYYIKEFPANWQKFGKSAGMKRNLEMSNYANALIAFHDGISKGTLNMIELARKKKLLTEVVKY